MAAFTYVVVAYAALSNAAEPNPPNWPDGVYVFDEANASYTQAIVQAAYRMNGGANPDLNGQFSDHRFAFLFRPGSHNVNVDIGYYTSLYGTGVSPKDTYIQGVASWDGSNNPTTGALCNFWRSAENFHIGQDMMWSVSQAAPLRKAHVDGDLRLSEHGYSSGGYMSDCKVSGTIRSGSQQQWMTRNTEMRSWSGAAFNMVFVGATNAPSQTCGQITNAPSTPIIAEKPYIVIDKESDKHSLYVPRLEMNKVGATKDFTSISDVIDFENVYVSTDKDDADVINSKLDSGLAVILTPGDYQLSKPIEIKRDDAILMAIGFPVLTPTKGNNVINVGNHQGVRIVGPMLLQGHSTESETLLQFGDSKNAGNATNPSILYSVFARIGGPNDPRKEQQKAKRMFTINSGNVIIDGTWLWRADHDVTGIPVANGNNPVETGLLVNGDNVIAYGLATEHTLKNMVEWNGHNGKVYFYQSEFPYDVTDDYSKKGYVSFKIGKDAKDFTGMGMGTYSYFRDHDVRMKSGMSGPDNAKLTNLVSVYLAGNGGIEHVYNDKGNSVQGGTQKAYLCSN